MAFTIKQSDTSPSIRATLQDSLGSPINLVGASVRFHMVNLAKQVILDEPMTVIDSPAGIVTYDWQTGDTDVSGVYYAEFEVTYGDGSVETFPNSGNISIKITPELI